MATTTEPKITAGQFIESDAHAIPVAGLLIDDPTLVAKQLTRTQWAKKLDDYLNSARP